MGMWFPKVFRFPPPPLPGFHQAEETAKASGQDYFPPLPHLRTGKIQGLCMLMFTDCLTLNVFRAHV